jgi:hypothetical protein
MYKIYNNEIKITKILKGGSSPTTGSAPTFPPLPPTGKTFDPKNTAPYIESPAVLPTKLVGTNEELADIINENNFKFYDDGNSGKLDLDELEKEEVKHLIPLNGYSIDFDNFSMEMKDSILFQYLKIQKTLNDLIEISPTLKFKGKYQNNTILHKNVLRYVISYLKEIEMYENGKILSFKDYSEKFADPGVTSASDPKYPKYVFYTWLNRVLGTRYENLMKKINFLMETYPETTSECKNMYAKIKVVHKLPHWVGFGGGYDSLNYCLNGGTLSALIRVPNLTNYFKSQLSVVEARLRNSNKTLSAVTKTQIQTVIDQLEKHEVFLKDTFELLKNSHLIDENKVDMTLHKDKLEKAKVSLRKHGRYSNVLQDIIKTILDVQKSNFPTKKYFE